MIMKVFEPDFFIFCYFIILSFENIEVCSL